MIQDAPHVRLLLGMEQAAKAVDYQARAGLTKPMTVRHSRNRNPVRGERPALTLIFVSADERNDDIQRNAWEVVWEMAVDLQLDVELATEDSAADPTGLGLLSRCGAATMEAFLTQGSPIWNLCDEIDQVEIEPSERSTPDEGRLVLGIRVLYRVRSDDNNVLLARGVDG